eukprot:scaffold215218_cov20-Prasinocladus_malaysianus.AAC.1
MEEHNSLSKNAVFSVRRLHMKDLKEITLFIRVRFIALIAEWNYAGRASPNYASVLQGRQIAQTFDFIVWPGA